MAYQRLLLLIAVMAVVRMSSGLPFSSREPEVLDTLAFNFTLAAINTTLPNANTTGAPLVLGQNGASAGLTFHVTSTYASYPYNDYPSLSLFNASLRAFTSAGGWITNATDVRSGGFLSWRTSTFYSFPAARSFTATNETGHDLLLLGAHGFTDLWSLCSFPGFRGQTNVMFNVSQSLSSFHSAPDYCYDVQLHVVPVNG